jgi:hypothetical protein
LVGKVRLKSLDIQTTSLVTRFMVTKDAGIAPKRLSFVTYRGGNGQVAA